MTVTGCDKVIDEEDFAVMKEGAILCNAGPFDCEIDMAGLRKIAVETKEMRKNIMGYKLPTGPWFSFWLRAVLLTWQQETDIRRKSW